MSTFSSPRVKPTPPSLTPCEFLCFDPGCVKMIDPCWHYFIFDATKSFEEPVSLLLGD